MNQSAIGTYYTTLKAAKAKVKSAKGKFFIMQTPQGYFVFSKECLWAVIEQKVGNQPKK